MSDFSIEVSGLGKRYRIGVQEPEPANRLAAVWGLVKAPFHYLHSTLRAPSEDEILWALRDASFQVRRGEVLAVVGSNGAGKSTLLKILSRVTEPSEGRVTLRGRVGSLLEVGTGFHPDLTGRENVFLNGSILGMRQSEIRAKFDEIVAFAQIGRFIDTPVKRYSSGMNVRLGFAVAAHLDPEVLIIDEVLAVGDAAFQQRCAQRIEQAARSGTTILLVSHRTATVSNLCKRALWLDQGTVRMDGDCVGVLDQYLEASRKASGTVATSSDGSLSLGDIRLHRGDGVATRFFEPGDPLVIEADLVARRTLEQPRFWFAVWGANGPVFGANMLVDGYEADVLSRGGTLRCRFDALPLLPNHSFTLRFGACEVDRSRELLPTQEVAQFAITGSGDRYGFEGDQADTYMGRIPPVVLPYSWGGDSPRFGVRPGSG